MNISRYDEDGYAQQIDCTFKCRGSNDNSKSTARSNAGTATTTAELVTGAPYAESIGRVTQLLVFQQLPPGR